MKIQVTQEGSLQANPTWQIVQKILRCLFRRAPNGPQNDGAAGRRNVTFLLPSRHHHEDIVLKRQKHGFVLPDAC